MKKSKLVSISMLASVALLMVGCGGRQTNFKIVGLGNIQAGSISDTSFVYKSSPVEIYWKPVSGPGAYYFMTGGQAEGEGQVYAVVSCGDGSVGSCIVNEPADAKVNSVDGIYVLSLKNGASSMFTSMYLMAFDQNGNHRTITGVNASQPQQPVPGIPGI
ncbi:hypothetical protein K2X30_07345 [bacterium]|jgi:hypothetical protein|nr:hypothetical protein [bacterium]